MRVVVAAALVTLAICLVAAWMLGAARPARWEYKEAIVVTWVPGIRTPAEVLNKEAGAGWEPVMEAKEGEETVIVLRRRK